jgi:hypothetical protein
MPIKMSINANLIIPKCKCGNYPEIGSRFWYKSKYDDNYVEGIVKEIYENRIISTKGVTYKMYDIEVKRVDILREEKLSNLGIKDE